MIKHFFFTNRIITGLIILIYMFSGCAAIGTKTIYKSNKLIPYNLSNLGYSQLASEEILNRIRPGTSKIYQASFEGFFSDKETKIVKHNLTKFELNDEIETDEIRRICFDNNLDGYICTQIMYKFVDNYYMSISFGKSEDAYVEMKLYNSMGELVIHTKHNTLAGNSYMMPPKAEQTIKDGTVGALKQIRKEIGIR